MHLRVSSRVVSLALGALLVGLGAGCLSDFTLPGDAVVTCAANTECPTGYVCEAGRCESATGNKPPRLTVQAPARASGDLLFSATLFDANADTLTLTAELDDGGHILPFRIDPTEAPASADGSEVAIFGVGVTLADTGATLPHAVKLRVTASDATRSATATADIAYGNAPPTALLTVDGSTSRPGTIGGLMGLHLFVSDSSSDPVNVTAFQVVKADDTVVDVPLTLVNFPDGGLENISTSPDGVISSLTWNSAELGLDRQLVTVHVRLDDGFGGVTDVGSDPVTIDNTPSVTPPAQAVGGIDTLRADWIIDDPNSESGDETVDLTLAVTPNGPPLILPATVQETITGLAAAPVTQTITWDIAADIAGVPSAVVETSRAPQGEPIPIFQSVDLTVTATDPKGLVGTASKTVTIGDDPPSVTTFPLNGVQRGDVAIAFSLADSSNNTASVQVEFQKDPSDSFHPIAVRLGLLDNLSVTTDPATFVVVWDSKAAVNDADPTAPQGIGNAILPNAAIRIRGVDTAGDPPGLQVFSPWTVAPVSLSNQSPPRIEPILVSEQGGIRNGAVPIAYRIIDEQSDAVNVAFEFSIDGTRFLACTEAPTPVSEGSLGLASAPEAAGGVVHTFVWDTGADILDRSPSVRVRVRAVDPFIDPTSPSVPTVAVMQPSVIDPVPSSASGTAFDVATFDTGVPFGFGFLADGDFNADGKKDVAYTFTDGNGNNFLQLWRGDGAGGLQLQVTRATPGLDLNAHAIDLDKDGSDDVFMESSQHLLRGPALLDAGALMTCVSSCRAVPADVDGDSVNDLLVLDSSTNPATVRVFAGAGVGPAYHLTDTGVALPSAPGQPVAGDFDGDGHPDLLIQVSTGVWQTLRGSGTFAGGDLAFAPLGPPLASAGDEAIVVDVDEDGRDDLELSVDVGTLLMFKGTGDGSFALIDSVDSVSFPGQHVLSDINGDGVTDVVIGSFTEQAALIAITRPGGGFLSVQRLNTFAVPIGIATADLDGNGLPDVVAATGFGSTNNLLVRGLTGTPPAPTPAQVSSERPLVSAGLSHGGPIAIDADRDGTLDFVMTTEFGEVTVARGTADGAITSRWQASYGAAEDFHDLPTAALLVDVNGDGLADDVAVGRSGVTCELQVWLADHDAEGVPDGRFTLGDTHADDCAFNIAAGLIDADGAIDLVTDGGSTGGSFNFYRNNGDGTFAVQSISTPLAFVAAVGVADFDGDGFADVVVADDPAGGGGPPDGTVLAFRGGPTGLTFATTTPVSRGAGALSIGDVDADGRPDIVAVPGSANAPETFEVLHGNGPGLTFTRVTAGSLPVMQITSTRLSDLDNDGALDFIFTQLDPAPSNIFFFPGNHASDRPLGTFAPFVPLASSRNLSSASMVDVTGDGAADIITTDFFGGAVKAFVGRLSLPFFSVTRDVTASGTSTATAVGPEVAWSESPGGPFGDQGRIAVRRVTGADDVLAGIPGDRGLGTGGDLVTLLRAERVLTGNARPLTGAFIATGDKRLVRVVDPVDPLQRRLRIDQRFGPREDPTSTTNFRRIGLDLSAAQPRGIIVDLPFIAGRTRTGNTKVLLGVPRWRTAAEVAADALSATATADQFLPRVSDGAGGERDLVEIHYDWQELPQVADFSQGSGRRFVVDAAKKRVRVLTDALGVLQVFDGT